MLFPPDPVDLWRRSDLSDLYILWGPYIRTDLASPWVLCIPWDPYILCIQ